MLSSVITATSNLSDNYAEFGLEHFLNKYGFKSSSLRENANLFIGYSLLEKSNFNVQIILKSDVPDEICSLDINGKLLPLFVRPIEVKEGQAVCKVRCRDEEYTCISISGNKIIIGFDIFSEIGRIVAGYYDRFFVRGDEFGNKLKVIPIVDILEKFLLIMIMQIIPNFGPLPQYTWPKEHRFALMLTHDVDRIYKTYQYLPSILNSIKKLDISELGYHLRNLFFKFGEKNPYWTFDIICDLEKNLGVKSTYYFLNEKGRHKPFSVQSWILYRGVYDIESPPIKEIIRKLALMGCEIGVHGSYNSYNQLELLRSEKHTLESIIGLEVIGIRQHYLNYDKSITSDLHQKAGFKYDSSVGFKPGMGVGFRRGTCFPFWIMFSDPDISPILEIPLTIMDVALDTKTAKEDCLKLMVKVEKIGGVLNILWHSNLYNQREYPGMVDLYKYIINEAKARNAWITSGDEIYKWVIKKNK